MLQAVIRHPELEQAGRLEQRDGLSVVDGIAWLTQALGERCWRPLRRPVSAAPDPCKPPARTERGYSGMVVT